MTKFFSQPIDLIVANPLAILLGPPIRRFCHWLYPDIKK